MEFVADDKVLGRGGNGESLIDGQLKVNIYRTDFVNIAIAVDRVSDGVPENDNYAAKFIRFHVTDDREFFIEICFFIMLPQHFRKRCVHLCDFLGRIGCSFLINMLGAVKGDHGASGLKSIFDFFFCLQMITVSAKALFVSFLEHVERRCGDYIGKGAVGQI